jgi:MFS transporter, ACS family, glucarate transporter
MLALLSVITYLDRICIAVAGPAMQEDLGISPSAWGWVTGIFFLSYGVFEIPTGVLGDRVGPRRVLTRIVVWWSAFTSLTGMVSNYVVLLATRFCFGMGEAGAYPNASTVIARWIPAAHRARSWGIVWMTGQIGAALSPVLVVPIQKHFGWRASFWVFGVLGVIWAVAWYRWFRDWPTQKAGVSAAELEEIGPPPATGHGGMPWARALRSPGLWQLMGIAACYVYALAFFQSWLQTYLVKGRGYTEAALILSSLPYVVGACANGLGGVTSDWLVRRLGLKRGRRAVGVFGLSVAAAFMSAAVVTTSGVWSLVFLSLAYAGILLQQPNICAVALDTARDHAGAVFACANTAAQGASVLSSVAFGYIVDYSGSYNAPFIPMVLTLCAGTWLWLKVDASRQLFDEETPPLRAAEVVTS